MIIRIRHYIFAPALAFLFLLASHVYAANVSQNVTLTATGGSDITLLAGGTFDTLTIGATSFTFALSGTQSVSLRDSDARVLNTNIDGLLGNCNGSNSEITLSASKGASITVSIEGSSCSGGSGGGGSYTSSGGGGTTSSTETTVTTTTTTTTTTPAPASTTQTTTSPYLAGAPPPAAPLSSGGAVIPAPVSVPAPVTMGTTFSAILQLNKRLSVGSSGEDVRALQEALASMPDIYPEGTISGRFGSLTKAAVARFQMKYGIVSSSSDAGYGSVGPMTRAKLQEVFGSGAPVATPPPAAPSGTTGGAITQELNSGDSGDAVTRLQIFLAADQSLYPEGKVTGYYGPLTVAAVKRFQARYGITQLGRVGPQTMAKLNELMAQQEGSGVSATPPPVSAQSGQSSDDASAREALQKQISDLQALMESLTKQVQSAQ